MDLKSTINLPKTDFPMKANLPQNEPKMLDRWEQMHIYERIRQARKRKEKYILHDGPPYTSGPIHLGTAMNKCLKDFIVKSKTMSGFDAPYVPGWDCHGLPIEIKVDKELGGKKLQMRPTDVRAECRKYAQKFLDLQRQQFKRIGVFGRFDKPYATMTPQYESVVLRTFFSFYENEFVYKGLRAVYWCMHDETALAEAEVEYENHTSSTVWVKYALLDDPAKIDAALAGKKLSTIIWTTTPWTLPASMAVAFHPDEEYVALESGGEAYIVASKLAKDAAEKCGLVEPARTRPLPRPQTRAPQLPASLPRPQSSRRARRLRHHGHRHRRRPYRALARRRRLRHRRQVRPRRHQQRRRKRHPAQRPARIRRQARLGRQPAHHRPGQKPRRAAAHRKNRALLSALLALPQSRDLPRHRAVVHLHGNAHARRQGERRHAAHAHAERDQESEMGPGLGRRAPLQHDLRPAPTGASRASACGACPSPSFSARAAASRSTTTPSTARSSNCSPAPAPMPGSPPSPTPSFPPERNARIAAARSSKRKPTSSTSGSNPERAISRWLPHEPDYYPWPSDLYLEGGDQYRGWFQSSLLCAMGTHATPPYRGVVTPGWTLDEKGQAMSKSRGNDVDPVDIASRFGGEIVRLWAASVDFREDVVGSEALMQRVGENYKKIRNTFRYILSNLYDFDPVKDAVPFDEDGGARPVHAAPDLRFR